MSRPRSAKSIAAQIEKSYKTSKRLLEESMQGLPKTCNAYLQRVLALAKLDQSHRDELAARGIVPVHLGNAARTVYHFSAVIDDQQVTVDAKRQAFEDELDEEFPSASAPEPAVPAVKKLKKTKRGKQ